MTRKRHTEEQIIAVLKDAQAVHGVQGLCRKHVIWDAWATQHGVHLHSIQPGKPIQNALIESFHGKFRDEGLSV